jgi:hypothetical protein
VLAVCSDASSRLLIWKRSRQGVTGGQSKEWEIRRLYVFVMCVSCVMYKVGNAVAWLAGTYHSKAGAERLPVCIPCNKGVISCNNPSLLLITFNQVADQICSGYSRAKIHRQYFLIGIHTACGWFKPLDPERKPPYTYPQ